MCSGCVECVLGVSNAARIGGGTRALSLVQFPGSLPPARRWPLFLARVIAVILLYDSLMVNLISIFTLYSDPADLYFSLAAGPRPPPLPGMHTLMCTPVPRWAVMYHV